MDNEYEAVTRSQSQTVSGVCTVDIKQYQVEAKLEGKCTLTHFSATEEIWGPSWSYEINIGEAIVAIEFIFVKTLRGDVVSQRLARWNRLNRKNDKLFPIGDLEEIKQHHDNKECWGHSDATICVSQLAFCNPEARTADTETKPLPQFHAFTVEAAYAGPTARPNLSTPPAREYRTRLIEAASEKANFAGHYILAQWSCGTACVSGAVLDAITG